MYGMKHQSDKTLYPGMNGTLPPEMKSGTRIDRWIYHSPLLRKRHKPIGALLIILTLLALVYPVYHAIDLTWIHPSFIKEEYVTATVTKCTEKPDTRSYLSDYSGTPLYVYDIEIEYEYNGQKRTAVMSDQKAPRTPGTTYQQEIDTSPSRGSSLSQFPATAAWFIVFFSLTASAFFFIIFGRYMRYGRVENAGDYVKYRDKITRSKKDKEAKPHPDSEPVEYFRDENEDPRKPVELFTPGLRQEDGFSEDIVASYDPDEAESIARTEDRFRPYDPDDTFRSKGFFYTGPDDEP